MPLLGTIHRHRIAGWTIAAIYGVVVTFPHEQVQTLVNWIAVHMGFAHFYFMMGALALAGGAVLSIVVFARPQTNVKKL